MSGRLRATLVIVAIVAGAVVWTGWFRGDEHDIRERLGQLRDDVNAGVTEGLGTSARSAAIGSFFAEDVAVDLGRGTAPIIGRGTVIDMVTRLQPRTAAFRLELQDIGVRLGPGRETAEVTLTASFIRRSISTGEESIDAREFALAMSNGGGTWRIARLTAVDTLK